MNENRDCVNENRDCVGCFFVKKALRLRSRATVSLFNKFYVTDSRR